MGLRYTLQRSYMTSLYGVQAQSWTVSGAVIQTNSSMKTRDLNSLPYHIVENEARVRELEVLEKAVEFAAVERTPGTVEIVSRLGLLPRVIVVQELTENTAQNYYKLKTNVKISKSFCYIKANIYKCSTIIFQMSLQLIQSQAECFPYCFEVYLIKYTQLLSRLRWDLLFPRLSVCADWLFHCWQEQMHKLILCSSANIKQIVHLRQN